MNNLEALKTLSNRYFVIRHGKSEANAQEIILSHPDEGTTAFGLVDEGREQVRSSVEKAKAQGVLDSSTIVISSDFTRCRETAEIAREILGAGPVQLTPKLRERYFGNYERQSNENYQKVWDIDKDDHHHKEENVESAMEVQDRVTSLITELEQKYSGQKILLSSHGDALQILQTGFEKVPAAKHRDLPHLNTAEIRELKLK